MTDAADRYFHSRFGYDGERAGVWGAIARYLDRYFQPAGAVLELGAGYCAFINAVRANERHALDIYPGFVEFAAPGVTTHVGNCEKLDMFDDERFDVVFASNLLEHFTEVSLESTLLEVMRVLKPTGRIILIQPNFRYCASEYFDDYTHKMVFSHISLADLLRAHGFVIERVEPRFLPFSMKSLLPKWPWMIRLYLCLPHRPLGKQMLIVGRREKHQDAKAGESRPQSAGQPTREGRAE